MAKKPTKYIFVTGGVLSGLGKGITAASLGKILRARGFSVNIQKCDPYLNTDAGTLNPAEHGEVFVTRDGAETDLDLGHYERFIDEELTRSSSLMNGRIYAKVIADERAGKYLGKTVQIIPHVTTEIQRQIIASGAGSDVHIVEIGGTVGDYESLAFLEAIRQLKHKVGAENVAYVHVVFLPFLEASRELKTKPAQNTIRDLRETGIQPDVLIARADHPVHQGLIDKLSLFGDVEPAGIVALPTVNTVYEVPLLLEQAGLGDYIGRKLNLERRRPKLAEWRKLVKRIQQPSDKTLNIGMVAKYLDHEDTYISVIEAIKAAAWANQVNVKIKWVNAEQSDLPTFLPELSAMDGLIVPGGFGARGMEGKISAAAYAADKQIPYLGLCLGLQMAVIALGRRVLGAGVNTMEVDPKVKHPVISLMADQTKVVDLGGTMRLGDYPCKLEAGSVARRIYGRSKVVERHRHRYEVNNHYRKQLEQAGLKLSGLSPDGRLVEIIELKNHPFFVASQFHPEFKSRPDRPHPLFDAFIKASLTRTAPVSTATRAAVS